MWMQTFFKSLTSISTPRRPARRRSLLVGAATRYRPRLEQLEGRTLLANFTAATVADLIADIHAANLQGGSNTIGLVAPLTSPYVLTAADNTTDGATGLPLIAARNNLTIFGNGNTIERSTAAGTPAFRLLDVASGAALTLENLTLQGGLASGSGVSASGGAIYSQGSLTLNGVTVQRNAAVGGDGPWGGYDGGDGLGGGLCVVGGTLTMTSSSLSANKALGGDGSKSFSPYLNGHGGPGGNGGSGLGGAVYVVAGTVIMTSDTLSANAAQGGRGGDGGNSPTDPWDYYYGVPGGNGGRGGSGLGGGLYVAGGTVPLTSATVSSNSAWAGAGGRGGVGNPLDPNYGGLPGLDGPPGLGQGGGLFIFPSAAVGLDPFTVQHVVNNTASTSYPDIFGSYSLAPQAFGFAVTGFPASTEAGAAGTFTVSAKNAGGTTATGYIGTVHFTSSDAQAGLPADYTFTAADAGVHAFSATLKTAGTQSLTVTDTTNGRFSGTETGITVNPAAADSLWVTAPAASTAGSAFGITVTARDGYNNTATGYTGAVHFTSSDGQAVLPANYAFTAADAGVHAFTGVILKTVGGQRIIATDTATAAITGNNVVTVNPATASTFLVGGFPSPTTAGAARTFTVTAKTASGATASNYTGTVHFSSSDGKASLPANYTFSAADAGVHTFIATLNTAGSKSLTATDTVTGTIMGSEADIVVKPAAAAQFILSAPSSVTPRVAFSLTLTVKDAYGNVVTGYVGRAHFTTSDGTATLPANYTFTAADAGMHTFVKAATLRKKGKSTLTVTDAQNSALTATDSISVV